MRPFFTIAIVPMSSIGTRPSVSIIAFRPIAGRTMPHFDRSPTASRIVADTSASRSASGSRDNMMFVACDGRPSRSRGTTCTGPRTTIDTSTPCSARSSAISAPELPQPTTSVRLPANGAGSRYADECAARPPNASAPGSVGTKGTRL